MQRVTRQERIQILSYLAGVIDSDGCITIKRRRVKTFAKWALSPSVTIRQVEPQAIELAQSIFGGNVRFRKSSTVGGKPLYHWEVSHHRAIRVSTELLPYLRIKQKQAGILIEYGKFVSNPENRRHPKYQWKLGEVCCSPLEASRILGCKPASVYQAVSASTIPSKRSGRNRLIPKKFLATYTMRRGAHRVSQSYLDSRNLFVTQIRRLNGPTKGVPTKDRPAYNF